MAFGRYLLESKLATGGMGEVFLARMMGPAGFEKKVVIKRVPVYKTRIVYRDREVEKPVPVVTPAETPAPLTPNQFVTQPETEPLMTAVTVFQETRPAQLAEEVEPEQLEPTQGRRDSPGTTIAQVVTDKITAESNAPTS